VANVDDKEFRILLNNDACQLLLSTVGAHGNPETRFHTKTEMTEYLIFLFLLPPKIAAAMLKEFNNEKGSTPLTKIQTNWQNNHLI